MMNTKAGNAMHGLAEAGQSVWLDYIRRDLMTSGELEELVDAGLRGMTSNPTIFEQAIRGSTLYDEDIDAIRRSEPSVTREALYERLAIEDIQMAADRLRDVYETSSGKDGYVSLEVSPHLADDTQRTVAEANRLFETVDRPNVMIKVPGTAAGVPAVEELIAGGININVTLMFSLTHYEAVAQAYLRGLTRTSAPDTVASVASFFVSRVDSAVDAALEEVGTVEALALRGRTAVANAKLTYQRFLELFGEEFEAKWGKVAMPQRVLWASTSTKNAAYSDLLYVEDLVGARTVNTMPPATLEAFADHGAVRPSALEEGIDEAKDVLVRLAKTGVDLESITDQLQEEGVAKFAASFDGLLAVLDSKKVGIRG